MKEIKKYKTNKGVTMMDIVVAIIVLTLFVGVITSLYYQIAYYNASIRMNAMAVHYAVKIAESIDKMTYEEVTEELNEDARTTYDLPDLYQANIEIKKYSEEDPTKEDIIKKVTITINYQLLDENKTYVLRKLKIKES